MSVLEFLLKRRLLLSSTLNSALAGLFLARDDARAAQPDGDASVRPFKFVADDEDLADLKRRIAATNWPERETVSDASQGLNLATMRKLARYWQGEYNWRRIEARLNSFPQFITKIDGLDIHFIYVRSKNAKA